MKISFFEHALAMILVAAAFTVLTEAMPWLVVAIVLAGQYLMIRQRMQNQAKEADKEIAQDIERIKADAPTPVENISARWKDMEIKEPKN